MREKLQMEWEYPIRYEIARRKLKNISKIMGFGLIFSGIGFGIGCLVYGFSKNRM